MGFVVVAHWCGPQAYAPGTYKGRSNLRPFCAILDHFSQHIWVESADYYDKANGRYGHRDTTLILVAYRHGLRAVEICDLEWSQVEFDRAATLHVRRAKNGKPAAHPIRGDELRVLRELQRHTSGGYVFETERGTPFTADAVNRLIKRIGERASFPFKVHVHMLRHACGYALANAGHDTRAIQDWLGHRAIQHTARYTELSQERFKDFWRP